MPELPEVESQRLYLLESVLSPVGRTVQSVRIVRASVVDMATPDSLVTALNGCRLESVKRHGKYLFFRFSTQHATSACWLVAHLRMTGRLYLTSGQEALHRHTRFALLFDSGTLLRFDDPRAFGRVWLIGHPDEVISRLGPDALTVTQEQFLSLLASARRQLKPLLLDQTFIAGVGNIYADELLFRAGLHPLRNSADLSLVERERLYGSLRQVMEEAVTCKGANIDGVFEAGCYPVAVYGRVGQSCRVCATPLVKLKVGQRGTHCCPTCQPVPVAGN